VCTLLLLRLMRGVRLAGGQAAGVVLALGVAVAFAGVLLVMSDKLGGADCAGRRRRPDDAAGRRCWPSALYTIVGHAAGAARHGGAGGDVLERRCSRRRVMLAGRRAGRLRQAGLCAVQRSSAWAGLPAWTVVVSGFVGWMLWSWVNATRGVARTAPLLYGVPPMAGVIAALTVGESFGPLKLLGAGVALAGVALTQKAGGAPGRQPRPGATIDANGTHVYRVLRNDIDLNLGQPNCAPLDGVRLMDFTLPDEITAKLAELDAFIEAEIKPLEREHIQYFDHRREYARTDWANDGRPHRASGVPSSPRWNAAPTGPGTCAWACRRASRAAAAPAT
jgi:hypothetical protein